MAETTFVGRQEYIDLFEEMLTAPVGAPYILNLRGPGGIGKSKLLQKFVEICEEKHVPHTKIVDFYGIETSSRITRATQEIVKSLSKKDEEGPFKKYWHLHEEFESKTSPGLEHELVREFSMALLAWLNTILATGQKGVLFFDTAETIKYTAVGSHLFNDWLPKFNQALVVISHRPVEGGFDFSSDIVPLVKQRNVEVFTRTDAINYLKERQVWNYIENEGVAEKLFDLTELSPLLLALSADWISDYAIFHSISPTELVQSVNKESFERILVERLPNMVENPESTIMPFMAHIIRPFNQELVELLAPITSSESPIVLKNLGLLSFVKEMTSEGADGQPAKFYWFQDEVRNLFHRYVFPSDTVRWNQQRRDVSQKMVEFYDGRIEKAMERGDIRIAQRHVASQLYHKIYLDPKVGFNEFHEKYQKARKEHQYDYASMLLNAVRFAYQFEYLSEQQEFTFLVDEGRQLRNIGEAQQAEERFLNLLDKNSNNSKRSASLLSSLGVTASKLGKLEESLNYHIQSINIYEKEADIKNIPAEERNIAAIYLKMGEWEKSAEHLKKAHELALSQKDWDRLALILFDLGRIYERLGEYEVALDYCNQAIDMWEELKSSEVAKGKILRGDIYCHSGDYDKALDEIKRGMEVVEELDFQNLTESYFYLGFAQWFKGIKLNDNNLRQDSILSFKECIEINERHNLKELLPLAYHEISHVYWELGFKKEARNTNQKAYDMAIKAHDFYSAVNSLVGMAEFDYDERLYDNIPTYAQQLRNNFEEKGYKFPFFYGRMRRIQGRIAIHCQNYNESIIYYAEGLRLIAQHGGYGKYTINEELNTLEMVLQTISSQDALEFCKALKQRWISVKLEEKHPKIISWVTRLIDRFVFKTRT